MWEGTRAPVLARRRPSEMYSGSENKTVTRLTSYSVPYGPKEAARLTYCLCCCSLSLLM